MTALYHRRAANAAETDLVRASGQLWGKAPRLVQGGGDACVKAFAGPLPADRRGYEFTTEIPPTRERYWSGFPGFVWMEGEPGVIAVPGAPDYVMIPVTVVRIQE